MPQKPDSQSSSSNKTPSLSHSLRSQSKRHGKSPYLADERYAEKLRLELVRVQQGLWLSKGRAIVVFEGFDAAGKGGCIRRLTQSLDARGVVVHPIGPPTAVEQGTHWLYRFWQGLPRPGTLAVFDRSWYGRVLVERVEGLAPREAWKRAFREIREFEQMLSDDGVDLIKIFLAVSPEEQLRRFRDRLEDPAKSWKLTMEDIEARAHWDAYVEAADDLLQKTHSKHAPWRVIPSDEKASAQVQVLEAAVEHFAHHCEWLDAQKKKSRQTAQEIRKALKKLEKSS